MDYHKPIISQVSSKRKPAEPSEPQRSCRGAVSHLHPWVMKLVQSGLVTRHISLSARLHYILQDHCLPFVPADNLIMTQQGLSTNTAPIHMDRYSIQGDKRRMQNQTTITV